MTLNRLAFGLAAALALAPVAASDYQAPIDIPYEQFKLDNGLTVVVHEDRKAPIVAVNLWYHVGSKNEKPGRTGSMASSACWFPAKPPTFRAASPSG